jgi:hypothetical protein
MIDNIEVFWTDGTSTRFDVDDVMYREAYLYGLVDSKPVVIIGPDNFKWIDIHRFP